MEEETIIIVSVFAAAWAVLFLIVVVLCIQVGSLRRRVQQMQATGRIRVQKLKMESDQNHAFHNATISPDEELSRRGYSMYVANGDPEAGRPTERDLTTIKIHTGGRKGKEALIITSAYLPYEDVEPITPKLRDLVEYGSQSNYHVIIGCDANAHHVVWGSSDINKRGEKVLEFMADRRATSQRDQQRNREPSAETLYCATVPAAGHRREQT